jgi:hypothetical protein
VNSSDTVLKPAALASAWHVAMLLNWEQLTTGNCSTPFDMQPANMVCGYV